MRSSETPQSVTSLGASPAEDRRKRMRTYLIAMGFRTVCFPLAVWALVSGWTVVGWTLGVVAVVMPSVAVMLANAVDQRRRPAGTVQSPVRALPPTP